VNNDVSDLPEIAFVLIDDMTESVESSIAGNTHYMCTAAFPVSKIDRDFSMFGSYSATLGARGYFSDGTTAFVTLGEQEFSYMLEEPRYAEMEYDDDETTEIEYIYNHLLEKEIKLNITKALNDESVSGRAQ